MKIKSFLFILLTTIAIHPANAAITYVDASTDNTALANGDPHAPAGSTASNNDNWDLRNFANEGTVYESNGAGGSGEDSPRLRTTLVLEANQQYDVYAYFWGVSNNNWRGRASLDNPVGDLPGYNTAHFTGSGFNPMQGLVPGANVGIGPATLGLSVDGSGFENGGYFANSVLIEEDNRTLFQIYLGSATADENGLIHIYIDDLASTTNANRTWYDGVGYELVPEPSVALLGGLGMFVLLRRRRA